MGWQMITDNSRGLSEKKLFSSEQSAPLSIAWFQPAHGKTIQHDFKDHKQTMHGILH